MPAGGSRKHPEGCKCGNCPKMGRPKAQRPTNANVAAKVLAQAKSEQLWLSMIDLERRRLGINKDGTLSEREKGAIDGPDYQGKFSIIPLTNLLRYLEDRAYGRPMDTVNHLHDKPVEHNVTVSIRGKLEDALRKALAR
jgi:hypothetical protein